MEKQIPIGVIRVKKEFNFGSQNSEKARLCLKDAPAAHSGRGRRGLLPTLIGVGSQYGGLGINRQICKSIF